MLDMHLVGRDRGRARSPCNFCHMLTLTVENNYISETSTHYSNHYRFTCYAKYMLRVQLRISLPFSLFRLFVPVLFSVPLWLRFEFRCGFVFSSMVVLFSVPLWFRLQFRRCSVFSSVVVPVSIPLWFHSPFHCGSVFSFVVAPLL